MYILRSCEKYHFVIFHMYIRGCSECICIGIAPLVRSENCTQLFNMQIRFIQPKGLLLRMVYHQYSRMNSSTNYLVNFMLCTKNAIATQNCFYNFPRLEETTFCSGKLYLRQLPPFPRLGSGLHMPKFGDEICLLRQSGPHLSFYLHWGPTIVLTECQVLSAHLRPTPQQCCVVAATCSRRFPVII